MSIASAIQNAQQKVTSAYTAVNNKGGTLPATQNLSNLPNAISSIPQGTVPSGTYTITANGTYDVTNYASADVNVAGGGENVPYNYGNFFILSDGTIMPVYFDAITTNSANFGKVIMTDGLTNLDGVRAASYELVAIMEDISASSISFDSITNAGYDGTTGITGGIGVKHMSFKSITGTFKANGKTGLFNSATNTVSAQTLESIDISNATTIYLKSALNGFVNLKEIKMDKAQNVYLNKNNAKQGGTFQGTSLESLSFPSLTSTSEMFFTGMLTNVTGCVVHFPSNLQSVIGSSSDVLNGFGGTNTTILFDLPATT